MERAARICIEHAAKYGFPRDSAEARALCEAAAAIRLEAAQWDGTERLTVGAEGA